MAVHLARRQSGWTETICYKPQAGEPTMVIFFPCTFGVKLPLLLGERFGQHVEIQALEFINAIPIEWRLCTPTDSITGWQESIPERKRFAFHDLQRPNRSRGTRGTPGAGVWLETRGIGDGTLAIWLRDETGRTL
jgi:hypothetical protein